MVEAASQTDAEWLTPSQAVSVVASRLSRRDDARAIELILDHAAEGQITSRVRRLVLATFDNSDTHEDANLPAGLWHAIKVGSTYAFWDTGDFDASIHRDGVGWLAVTARGVRLLGTDILAIVPDPTTPEMPMAEASVPQQPWSESQMREAIAACPIPNRDQAWKQLFKQNFSEHGWTNEPFRELWSLARGSKGQTGRPPKQK